MNIKIQKASERGGANHGWLDARHYFSFGRYHHPEKVHFGLLRVLNDDKIAGLECFVIPAALFPKTYRISATCEPLDFFASPILADKIDCHMRLAEIEFRYFPHQLDHPVFVQHCIRVVCEELG